jgi:hypothetical protein
MSQDYSPPADEIGDMEIRKRLFDLRDEHRALDAAILEMHENSPNDQISLGRLKRKKLQLKDMIAFFEDQLRPDIIA